MQTTGGRRRREEEEGILCNADGGNTMLISTVQSKTLALSFK